MFDFFDDFVVNCDELKVYLSDCLFGDGMIVFFSGNLNLRILGFVI